MTTPVDPAGSAAAALNTQAVAVQRPPQPPVNVSVENPADNTRPADNNNGLAPTSRVNPGSRLGNFIDIMA